MALLIFFNGFDTIAYKRPVIDIKWSFQQRYCICLFICSFYFKEHTLRLGQCICNRCCFCGTFPNFKMYLRIEEQMKVLGLGYSTSYDLLKQRSSAQCFMLSILDNGENLIVFLCVNVMMILRFLANMIYCLDISLCLL